MNTLLNIIQLNIFAIVCNQFLREHILFSWNFALTRYLFSSELNKNNCLLQKWYFVSKTGLTYCEKKLSSDREIFFKFEAEGREFAKFLRSLEQLFEQWKARPIFETECYLTCSWRFLRSDIGKNNWDLETYRKSLKKDMTTLPLQFFLTLWHLFYWCLLSPNNHLSNTSISILFQYVQCVNSYLPVPVLLLNHSSNIQGFPG